MENLKKSKLEQLKRYEARHSLVNKELPLEFTVNDDNIWLTGIHLTNKVYDSYTIKIPEFVYGIQLSGQLYSHGMEHWTHGAQNNIYGKFNHLIIDGQDVPLIGTLNQFLAGVDAQRIQFRNFDARKIYEFSAMFLEQRASYIDLSGLKTENMKYITNMFQGCKNLEQLDLSNLNMENVRSLKGLFEFCNQIKNIRLPEKVGQNIRTIAEMCECCTSLESINLQSIYSEKIVDMSKAFLLCKKLQRINLENLKCSGGYVDTREMFGGAKSLKQLTLSKTIKESLNNQSYALKDLVKNSELEILYN